jgi:hypothetical protein
MKRQEYICDECGLESHVKFKESAGIIYVVHLIADDHKKWSPECKCPVDRLRCVQSPVEEVNR